LKNRLQQLYALQLVDLGLDELLEHKGNLPTLVEELTEKVNTKKKLLSDLETIVKKSKVRRNEADGEISTLRSKINKYKQQQFQIKTNKQYDALTKEIEYSQTTIEKLEKELVELEGKTENAKSDAEKLPAEIKALEKELDEHQDNLDVINKEHEEEELKLKHKRDKLAVRVPKAELKSYERIRKAKEGKAVVPIVRNSCGGCFHRVPPQLLLELRKSDRMINCEHCGRIIVSDEIVEESKGTV
jgi:hypothetical protein